MQLDLFRQGPTEPALTARQRFALAFIKASGVVEAGQLGASLHEYRMQEGGRGHRADVLCRWCVDEGRDMAAALERKGLVKRAEGGFASLDHVEPVHGHDPATAPIPF